MHNINDTGINLAEGIAADSPELSYRIKPPLARRLFMQSLLFSAGIHIFLLTLLAPQQLVESSHPLVIEARLAELPAMADELEEPEEIAPTPPSEPVAPLPVLKPENTPPIATVAAKQADLPPPVPKPQTTPVTPAVTPTHTVQAVEAPKSSPATPDVLPPTQAQPLLSIPIAIDTTWYLARQVDKQPKAIGTIVPNYPEDARRAGIKGNVKLRLKIDDLGRVRDIEVVESTPSDVFDEAALDAFKNARFDPAIRHGKPVRYEAYIRVLFNLE